MQTKPNLFKSRKFWIMIFDVVVSLVVTIGGWYLAPAVLDRIISIIAILQPTILLLIAAIAYEDKAAMETAAYGLPEK